MTRHERDANAPEEDIVPEMPAAPGVHAPLPEPEPELDDDDRNEEEDEAATGCGWRLLLVTLLVTLLAGGGLYGINHALRSGWLLQAEHSYSGVSLLPSALLRPALPEREIQIYFVARGRALDYRSYKLRAPAGGVERVDLIRQAITNPADPERFQSPLPPGATIRGVFVMDGIVWLDLSKEFQAVENPSPLLERLTVYALVNTFLLNDPSLQGVRFLVEGQPITTAWGWLDLSSPLGVNLALIG